MRAAALDRRLEAIAGAPVMQVAAPTTRLPLILGCEADLFVLQRRPESGHPRPGIVDQHVIIIEPGVHRTHRTAYRWSACTLGGAR